MRGFKPKVNTSKHLERLRQGGSNFGGHSAKGIKHGVRGRNLSDISYSKLMRNRMNYDDGFGDSA